MLLRFRRVVMPAVCALATICCCTQKLPAQTSGTSITAPASDATYVLCAGDDIEVTFFYNPELNQHSPIRPDGRISMPLIGEVQAQGLSVQRFTDVLKAAYAPELKRVSLNVQLHTLPNQVYYVGGEVARPGVQPLRGAAVSALQALIEAGGLRESAAHATVIVLRKGASGNVEVHSIALQANKGMPSATALFTLQPLDVLMISESRINKMDRFIDQYVRRLSPALLTGGFTYLFGNTISYK
jgi:polysaccharide export outer membrane protein